MPSLMFTRRTVVAGAFAALSIAMEKPVRVHRIFELRNYLLKPGRRDELIALFEREFVESQEAAGLRVVATFRNLDDPDRFVWIRSFADMQARKAALEAFYNGPVWAAHREAANATMIDSDNVLLLHPAGAPVALPSSRPPLGAEDDAQSVFIAATYTAPHADAFAAEFAEAATPAVKRSDGEICAAFAAEHSKNTFPRLPVRENESVFVALLRFDSGAASRSLLDGNGLAMPGAAAPEILRLHPTARSLLR
ncbi:MAG: NIPSNAP family protein [Pseudomonadota bacterium]|nr:NIPSNAP family protein [Pseudomonadota bacterium]